jgi:hypothetical protein
VASDDGGSVQLADGSDGSLGGQLSSATLDQTFVVREGAYNEWRVRDCEVVGVFVASGDGLLAKKKVPLCSDGVVLGYDIAATPIMLGEVFAAFPGLPVYTITTQGWLRVEAP